MKPPRAQIVCALLWAPLLALLLAARSAAGGCAGCPDPPPPAAPVLPLYPGGRDYAESRLFFDGGFLWRAGYRAPAGAAAAAAWHRAALAQGGWTACPEEQQRRLNEFFAQTPEVMTALRKADVTAVVGAYPMEGTDDCYVMLNIRFPWKLAGGPGSFGEEGPLYPAGRVLLRMFQSGAEQFSAYELAQCPDGPAAVLPYVAEELRQRGWEVDRERAIFSAQLRFDDQIRMFNNAAGESFVVMALPGDAFSWHYIFLKRLENIEKGSVRYE